MTTPSTSSTLPTLADALRPITLEGTVVRLEPLTLDHVPALARAAGQSRDTYGFTWVPSTEAEARSYVEAALRDQASGIAMPFATIRRETGEVVGNTRFGNIERWAWPEGNPNARPIDAVEIGWTWLGASAQRSPVNTEAKYLQLCHAFETWRVHRLILKTDERNARSRAAIERIGARFEAILRSVTPASDGTVRSSALYSIVESEWPEVKARLAARLAESRG